MKIKELIRQAFDNGTQAFKNGLNSIPAMNPAFINSLPNCGMGDEKGCRLRVRLYKAYILGWTIANLDQ